MKIARWLLAASAALLLVVGGQTFADTKKGREDSSFGSIRGMEAAEAQKAAEAWLKSVGKTDEATQTKFKAIWASDRPLVDRVAETLVLGDAEAGKLLADARNNDGSAPVAVPALLKNKDKPAFYRANLTLAYARVLTVRKVYEEALEAFNNVKVDDVVDPSAYLFFRAVCEYELMLKDKAEQTLDRLLVSVTDAPERYRMVGALMHFDMMTWQEKDLGWIARKMDNIQRRLDLRRGGKQTQKMQREVLVRLDEMIKELENQSKCAGGSCPNGGGCPGGGEPGGGSAPGTERASRPQDDTRGGTAKGTGAVDRTRVKETSDIWGKLQQKDRTQAIRDLSKGLPAKDRAVVEAYLRELEKRSRK